MAQARLPVPVHAVCVHTKQRRVLLRCPHPRAPAHTNSRVCVHKHLCACKHPPAEVLDPCQHTALSPRAARHWHTQPRSAVSPLPGSRIAHSVRASTHLHHARAHTCPRLAHGGTQAHACSRGVQAGACPWCPSSHTQAAGTEPPRARLTNTPTTHACACTDTHEAACGAQRGWGCQSWGRSPHS